MPREEQMTDKLRSKAGETLAETLVALLIAAVSVAMVAGSVVAAARINAKTAKQDVDFSVVPETTQNNVPVTFKIDGKTADQLELPEGVTVSDVKVTVYGTDNGYYYYVK